jgi:cytoskeletal protein CcmA (bactofilin family)
MFDMGKRGSRQEESVADEFEKDRFGAPAPGVAAPRDARPGVRVREAAIIGPSIQIEGDLRGDEDLIIEGKVSGAIHLGEHALTIGSNGKVKADVYANSVIVDGSLEGDLYGYERVAIRKGGSVKGNIISPRVALDDGARFKGTVEMDQSAVDSAFGRTGQRPSGGSSSAASGQNAASSGSRPSGVAATPPTAAKAPEVAAASGGSGKS